MIELETLYGALTALLSKERTIVYGAFLSLTMFIRINSLPDQIRMEFKKWVSEQQKDNDPEPIDDDDETIIVMSVAETD